MARCPWLAYSSSPALLWGESMPCGTFGAAPNVLNLFFSGWREKDVHGDNPGKVEDPLIVFSGRQSPQGNSLTRSLVDKMPWAAPGPVAALLIFKKPALGT